MQYSINMKANELQQYIEQQIGVHASDRRNWEITTEDFGVTSESRATAIKALERSLAIIPNGEHINAAYWGLMQVGDLNAVQNRQPDTDFRQREWAKSIDSWRQKTAVDPTVASSEADSSATGSMVSEVSHMSYDQHVTDIVTTRDGHCLVCLDRANVQAVHIFPVSVSESHHSKAQTDRLRFPPIEALVNTKAKMEMTVNEQVQYEHRRIATMEVKHTSHDHTATRSVSTDNSFLEDDTSAWSCQKIMRYDTNPPVLRFTSDIIEIKTIDSVAIPLPNADLMLLAYHIGCITRMRGQAVFENRGTLDGEHESGAVNSHIGDTFDQRPFDPPFEFMIRRTLA
ncbi:hypothetical protein LTS10_010538 [Elasticomyces elasticus]|nr:hypothetical protein LTS10_010538 [Elasticomyces elasticus]